MRLSKPCACGSTMYVQDEELFGSERLIQWRCTLGHEALIVSEEAVHG